MENAKNNALMIGESRHGTFVSISELQQAVNDITTSQFYREALMEIFSFESYPKIVNGEPGYEVNCTGTFRGLGQFSRYTWELLSSHGLDYPYSLVGNVFADVKATYLLLLDSERFHKNKFGVALTKEIAYLYHNQGAPSAEYYLRTGVLVEPAQSEKAVKLFETINREEFTVV